MFGWKRRKTIFFPRAHPATQIDVGAMVEASSVRKELEWERESFVKNKLFS